MITVHYDRCHGHLLLRGHAGSAPKGRDLICAAVSALCVTLAENLRKAGCPVVLEPGYARFRCREKKTRRLLDVFYLGLEVLADRYPDHIRTKQL